MDYSIEENETGWAVVVRHPLTEAILFTEPCDCKMSAASRILMLRWPGTGAMQLQPLAPEEVA